MALIIDESFEYRHKKFDLRKRSRDDSSNSSDDYKCVQVEIERLGGSSPTQQSMETSASSPTAESNYFASTPSPKRRRTSSFSDASYATAYSPAPFAPPRYTSTPIAQPSATIIAPPAAILPRISQETLRSICKYHGNMVRKFPKKERTPKDQERRDKNTIACRMSRRVKKLEQVAIEEQYKEFSQQTYEIIERAMRSTVYLHELMRLVNITTNNEAISVEETEMKIESPEQPKPTTSTQDKKPFSIDYLIGNRK